MADFNALMANPSFAAGLGLLAASGRNNMTTGQRIASGLLGGMHTSQQGQLFNLKMAENKKKQEQEASKQEAIKNLLASLSPQFDPTAALAAGEAGGDTGPTMTNAARVTPGKQMDYNTAMQLQLMGGPDLSGIIGKMNDGPKLETIYNEKGLETKSRWNPETKTFEQVGGAKATPLHFANLGGQTAGLDPFTGQQQVALQNSMSPDAKYRQEQGGGTPYFMPIPTANGVMSFNARTGGISPVSVGGSPVIGAQYDPALQGALSGAKASGRETGKSVGEATSTLSDMEASLPRLETVVGELRDLGKKATYTMTGQGVNILRREAGVGVGEGAVARKEYISKVDNEILPLLRQTFGAQFTQKEGESLKATLGDPNASPEEKNAVLTSFINTKKGQIESLKRRTSPATGVPPAGGGWGIRRLP